MHSLANLLLVESGDGVEGVEADEAAVLGLAELAAEGVRQPLVGQQLVEAEQVANPLKHWLGCVSRYYFGSCFDNSRE